MNRILNVVKIGGNVVNDPLTLKTFLSDFARLAGPKILVHGGGREATAISSALGIETTMIGGRRVTDAPTLDVVTMVYAGLVNKRIVAALQSLGCDAIGLSGADGSAIRARRRNPEPIDFGYVGDIDSEGVNVDMIAGLVAGGFVPVFCAITHDGRGQLLNCNADSVASALACALASRMEVRLIYCFEKPGVLADPSDDTSVIPLISSGSFASLKAEGIVSGGMLPKIENALAAVGCGVESVVIKSAESLLKASAGTVVRR